MTSHDQSRRGVVNVEALYSADTAGDHLPQDCRVVEEDALLLDIDGVGHYNLMWTPAGVQEIAHGYTFEDGVLGEIDQSLLPFLMIGPRQVWP